MTPDFQAATTAAYETILKYGITSAPVDALPIIRSLPNTFVVSFTEMAYSIGLKRDTLLTTIGDQCQDAVTSVRRNGDQLYYIVAYNQRMPFYMLQRAFARELAHIVLGHDGSRPEEVRTAEAQLFAMHLLCPRPMVKAIENAGVQITVEMIGSLTGCYGRCLAMMRKAEGVYVPPELNRAVRDNFADYVRNFLDYHTVVSYEDESPVANFGTFMDGYEE